MHPSNLARDLSHRRHLRRIAQRQQQQDQAGAERKVGALPPLTAELLAHFSNGRRVRHEVPREGRCVPI